MAKLRLFAKITGSTETKEIGTSHVTKFTVSEIGDGKELEIQAWNKIAADLDQSIGREVDLSIDVSANRGKSGGFFTKLEVKSFNFLDNVPEAKQEDTNAF